MPKPSPVKYRRAALDDLETLIELRVRFLNEFFQRADAEDTLKLRRDLEDYFRDALPSRDFVAFVAERDGRIIGTSSMVISRAPPKYGANPTGEKGYIMNMFTVPEERRQGIGTRLLGELVENARGRGITYVHLHAAPEAAGVYRKSGFGDPVFPELGMRLV